jgi:hypothetical protein
MGSLKDVGGLRCANPRRTNSKMRLLDQIALQQSHPHAQQHRYNKHYQEHEVSSLVERGLQGRLVDFARHCSRSDE